MYPDYLAHYGVKGMKWGVRKWMYRHSSDRARFGKRGVKRIQKRKASGMTRAEAVKKEAKIKTAKDLAIVGALVGGSIAAPLLVSKGAGLVRKIWQNSPGVRMDEIGSYYNTGSAVVYDILTRLKRG